MKFVIYLNNQSINYEGEPTFEELLNHITLYLNQVPKKSFSLSYMDEEGDQIELTSDEDMTALKQSMSKYPDINVFVNSQDDLKFLQGWQCNSCTYLNKAENKPCEICMSAKQEDSKIRFITNQDTVNKSKVVTEKKEKKADFKPSEKSLTDIIYEALYPIQQEQIKVEKKEEQKVSAEKVKMRCEKLSFLDEKIEKLMLKKNKLNKKCIVQLKAEKQQKKVLNQEAPKPVAKKDEEKISVFQGIERHFEGLAKQLGEGKIDQTEFNNEWNNEASILKKRVQVMKGQAIKQLEEKQKANTLTELIKQKLELEKQLALVSKSVVEQEQKEAEKVKNQMEKAQKIQESAQKQVSEVNNLKPLQQFQEKERTFEQKLQEIVQVYGGKAQDYEQLLCIFPDATIEDLCDMITQMRDVELSQSYISQFK